MLRIAMDSAGDLPAGWLTEFEIDVIPINIHFSERMYLQGVDLTNQGFYSLVEQTGVIPKTSQPTPHQFVEFYRRIAKPGDTVLSVHVTRKLSGTFSSAEIAAQELAGEIEVLPFDSGAGSAGQGFLCRAARQMERMGHSYQEITAHLAQIRKEMRVILTLDNLDYARMSGRVKALQAALASLLNVKPVVVLQDGVLDMADKVRTRSKALDHILAKMKAEIGSRPCHLAVVHAQDEATGRVLLERAQALFNIQDYMFTELSIGIAANLGPGTVGIVAYPV